jgi:hypothetical protein
LDIVKPKDRRPVVEKYFVDIQIEMVKFLVANSSKETLDLTDDMGRTALHYAAQGKTTLHCAAQGKTTLHILHKVRQVFTVLHKVRQLFTILRKVRQLFTSCTR